MLVIKTEFQDVLPIFFTKLKEKKLSLQSLLSLAPWKRCNKWDSESTIPDRIFGTDYSFHVK